MRSHPLVFGGLVVSMMVVGSALHGCGCVGVCPCDEGGACLWLQQRVVGSVVVATYLNMSGYLKSSGRLAECGNTDATRATLRYPRELKDGSKWCVVVERMLFLSLTTVLDTLPLYKSHSCTRSQSTCSQSQVRQDGWATSFWDCI